MAKLLALTQTSGARVYVNIDNVSHVIPAAAVTHIRMIGSGNHDVVVVTESPDTIAEMALE